MNTVRMATYRGEVTPPYERLPVRDLIVVSGMPTPESVERATIVLRQTLGADVPMVALGPGVTLDSIESAAWRAFNRLSAAVSKHLARSQPDHPAYRFADENDEELHAAYTRVLREIAPGGGSCPE